MENKEVCIFTSDIEVPETVQRKADAAFAQIKKERMDAMKNQERDSSTKKRKNKIINFLKPVIAAAACAVLITGVGVNNHVRKNYADPKQAENGVGDERIAADEAAWGNMFVMTAYAQELEPGKPVPMIESDSNSGRSSVFGGDEEGNVSYCINTEFLCQGENIERVGYSINRGAFQVIQPINADERIIVDGQPFEGELNTGSIGGGWDEALDVQPQRYETALYQSFIVDYGRQSAENTWINICNEISDGWEIVDLMWGENGLEKENEGINKLLDHTVITCTAYYADGTSQSVDIEVKSRVMTYEEAGVPSSEDEIPQDTKGTFITYEVK